MPKPGKARVTWSCGPERMDIDGADASIVLAMVMGPKGPQIVSGGHGTEAEIMALAVAFTSALKRRGLWESFLEVASRDMSAYGMKHVDERTHEVEIDSEPWRPER